MEPHDLGVTCMTADGLTSQRCSCGWESVGCDAPELAVGLWTEHNTTMAPVAEVDE
jgi:hypothetical protein